MLLDELESIVYLIVADLAREHGASVMVECSGAHGNPIAVLNHQRVCKAFARKLKEWADEEEFDNHQLQLMLGVFPPNNKKVATALYSVRFWQTKWDTL